MRVSGDRAKSALLRTFAASRHETWGRLRAASLFVRYWVEQFRVPYGTPHVHLPAKAARYGERLDFHENKSGMFGGGGHAPPR
jgi:hypothetical protein